MGQQWPAMGTGALAAADLGHTVLPTIEWSSRQPTNWRTVTPRKFFHCCKRSTVHNDSPTGDLAKVLRTTRGFDFEGLWDLTTELPQHWRNTLGGHKQKFVCTRTQQEGTVIPQEAEPDLPVSVQESPAELWVGSGLQWGQRH